MRHTVLKHWRLVLVALMPLSMLIAATASLCHMHFGNHSRIRRETTFTRQGLRGGVYDRNGSDFPMAVSLPGRRFSLDPKSVKPEHNREQMARIIGEFFNRPYSEIVELYARTNSRYIYLGTSLDDAVYTTLTNRNNFSGLSIEDEEVRHYSQERRMSHVLGFVNKMGIGGAGIEQQYNKFLTGSPGEKRTTVDGKRRVTGDVESTDIPAIRGADVFLTLDHNIQYVVESALKDVVEQFTADGAWSIVQLVKTGEILAMASYPDFAPDSYNDESIDRWRNSAVAAVYEPGSIMKGVAVAAALNERIISPNTMFDTGAGTWFHAGKPLRDHVTGYVSTSTAIKKSSNIACAKIGLMLNNQRMEAYLRAFGFGDRLGIDLPGEECGILGRAKTWDKVKPTRIPIGQGVAVTGLQMINSYTTIANGGNLMRPYVVSRVVSPSGEVILENKPRVIGRPIRPEVARVMREMLLGVTEEGGTGRRAVVEGYTVAGKTGTAQKAVRGGYSSTDYYASFVGFVPAREPVFSVLVSVECPQPQHTGGFVAAPVFARIASATAQYLAIQPDIVDDE